MRVIKANGVEKRDNEDLLEVLNLIEVHAGRLRSDLNIVTKQLEVNNLHLALMNDQTIEHL